MTAKVSEKTYSILINVVCCVTALLCLYPLIYTLLVSFCAPNDINSTYFLPIPEKFTLQAYAQVMTSGDYILTAIGVSVFRTLVGTLTSLAGCALFAYALSRKEMPGRSAIIKLVLFCILFSGGLIPTFIVIESLQLTDSIWVYILPNIMNVWNVIIIKQFFEGLPRELEEAANIDGAGEWTIFSKVVFPMSKPVMASIGLFTLVGQWNSWFDAFLYVSNARSDLWPLQYYIQISFNNLNQINSGNIDKLEGIMNIGTLDNTTMQMALTVIASLPVLIVYPFFQKYFTKGVYLGSVKG